ncbi:hypothetical protein QYZ87_03285 [Porphyromonadaceae bacterium W3.11]|nr:hypothetical protein [Porphyromonadaceae bacterium W3.11]
MEVILIIIALIAFLYIWNLIKRTYKVDSLDELLDQQVKTLEDEDELLSEFDEWEEFYNEGKEEKSADKQIEEKLPEPKKPVFIEGRGYIFQETAFVNDDDLELEIIDEHMDEQGGVDPWFIHESLRKDLRRGIILKEVLGSRYNHRYQ